MSTVHNPNADPLANALLGLAVSMSTGNPSTFIHEQEAAGQAQLVNSTVLPVQMGDRAGYEAVGFTFGDPVPGDDLFIEATLPAGWAREGTEHAMWSTIVDDLGRERVAVFYKAAFYDRKAHMSLTPASGYAMKCANLWGTEAPTMPILDEEWATRDAFVTALNDWSDRETADADRIEESLPGREPKNADACREIVTEQRARVARARAFAATIAEG